MSLDALRAMLEREGVAAAHRIDDRTLDDRAPDPEIRAALVALSTTVAAPLLDAFLAGALPVTQVEFGVPASPGRIVGPPASGGPGVRVVNERYRNEFPILFAPSLAHDLLWRGPGAGQVEEATLHAVCAMVYVQWIARMRARFPNLGTELARRQNSLAITLLNSRRPGSADITLVAPDGLGTLPGGAPEMPTPDFWSVPFGPDAPSTKRGVPSLLAPVLQPALAHGVALPDPLRYDDSLTEVFRHPLGRAWLNVDEQHRAAVVLGLLAES